jgi:hypothetical protein
MYVLFYFLFTIYKIKKVALKFTFNKLVIFYNIIYVTYIYQKNPNIFYKYIYFLELINNSTIFSI